MSERLEDIREQFRWGLVNLLRATANLDNDDIDYLIKQAERVNELEKHLKQLRLTRLQDAERVDELEDKLDFIKTSRDGLREKNKRYQEALEFYANRQAYYFTDEHQSEVMEDYGEIARKALEGETNG